MAIYILSLILINTAGLGICYFLVFLASRFKRIRAKILVTFMLFGFLMGVWSLWVDNTDAVIIINPLAYHVSDRAYNHYLLPYWLETLEPAGYEEVPIGVAPAPPPQESPEPAEVVGTEIMPTYDFPIKKMDYLFLPITLLFWGLIGLIAQLIYSASKKQKNLPQ